MIELFDVFSFQRYKKEMVSITTGIAVITLFISVKLIYSPTRSALLNLDEKINCAKKVITSFKNADVRIKASTKLKGKFPQETDTLWIVNIITELANKLGITVVSVEPKDPQLFKDFPRLTVVFGLNCDYHQFGRFISAIENSNEVVKIDHFEFKNFELLNWGSKKDLEASKNANILLTLSTLVLPAEP